MVIETVSAEETSICVYGAADCIAKIKIYQILGSAVDLRTGGGSVGAFKIYRIGNVGRKNYEDPDWIRVMRGI